MPKLFIALDFARAAEAKELVNSLEGLTGFGFKVGLQLFLAEGREIMPFLAARGYPLFLDLKFNDIPNTVAGALNSVREYAPCMVNLHILAGPDCLRRAAETVSGWTRQPLLIGVTLLTSLAAADITALGFGPGTLAEHVVRLARIGHDAGLHGVVCANHEVRAIKRQVGEDFLTITPGIRIHTAGSDQKRVATIDEARASGTDYIVVGRAITRSADPAKTVAQIMPTLEAFS